MKNVKRALASILLCCSLIFTGTAIPAVAATTEAKTQQQTVVQIKSQTKKVYRGDTATIKIKGKAKTKYSIKVTYKTTTSKAKGLETKTSTKNGNVTWTWKIGTRTTPGTYTVTIKGGGETIKTTFKVLKK